MNIRIKNNENVNPNEGDFGEIYIVEIKNPIMDVSIKLADKGTIL